MSSDLAAARDRLQHLHEVERLGMRAREHALRCREARRDRVHGDAVLAELARRRPREPEDAALRRDVVREVRRARHDHVRGDVDDAPVARLAHRLLRVVGQQEGAVEVHRHDPAPLGEVDLVPRLERDDRRGVHRDVELAEALDGLLDQALDLLLLRHVHLDAGAAVGGCRRRALTVLVGHDDGRALLRELVGDRLADSLCRARDDGHAAVELSHLILPVELRELVGVGCLLVRLVGVHVVREEHVGTVLVRRGP